MSKEMREFSLFHNLQLIDTHPRFRELLAGNTPRSKYFCGDINSHPHPAGNAEIAALVAEVFEPH